VQVLEEGLAVLRLLPVLLEEPTKRAYTSEGSRDGRRGDAVLFGLRPVFFKPLRERCLLGTLLVIGSGARENGRNEKNAEQ